MTKQGENRQISHPQPQPDNSQIQPGGKTKLFGFPPEEPSVFTRTADPAFEADYVPHELDYPEP